MLCTDKGSMVHAQYCSKWTELWYGMLVHFLCSNMTYEGRQGRRNEFRSGTVRTGVWGCDPQRGSKGQSPWWGSGGKVPWKPALFKNLNHNLYSKLTWDYNTKGLCDIITWDYNTKGLCDIITWDYNTKGLCDINKKVVQLTNSPIRQSWRCIRISVFFFLFLFLFVCLFVFMLKSGAAKAAPAVAVPTPLKEGATLIVCGC